MSNSAASGNLVLVTGATGFIGKNLCSALLEKGYSVRILARRSADTQELDSLDCIEVCTVELDDEPGLLQACTGVSVVFHLAAIAHVNHIAKDQIQKVNVEGTRAVLEACLKASVPKLIYFSSILVQELDTARNNSVSAYARSKKQAEELLLAAESDDFQPTILRPVNVYGPGMKGNIAGLIRRIRAGKLPPLPYLTNQLYLVSVNSLCEAAILAATNNGSRGKTYTICDESPYTPIALENAIYAALKQKRPDWYSPRMLFYVAALVAQVANKLGLWKNDLGLRTYRNLTRTMTDLPISSENISVDLGFKTKRTFSDELPAILEAL